MEVEKEEMRRVCKKCIKWENHFYWFHMDLTKISFCKKMDNASFKNNMDLPMAFGRNFKCHIAETVELRGPSKNVWRVDLIKSAETYSFRSGWKEFVTANNIEENDTLVFKYSGNSSFHVCIFDASGCERTSFFAKKDEIKVAEMSDSSVRIVDGPVRNMHQDNITISGSWSSDSVYSTGSGSVPVRTRRQPSNDADTSKEDSRQGGEFKAPNTQCAMFSRRWRPTPAQEKRVAQLSEGVEPGNHYFLICISNISLRCNLSIPTNFATEHLPKETKKAILHYKKKAWTLSLFSKKRPYVIVSGGWMRFVKDNNLQEGDICLFELMKSQEPVWFRFHISRN